MKPITFEDGYLTGVKIEGSKVTKDVTGKVAFKSKTVGFNRFYRAKQEDIHVTKVVRFPLMPGFDPYAFTHIDLREFRSPNVMSIYRVVQVQELFDEKPAQIQLSLEKIRTAYKDGRV